METLNRNLRDTGENSTANNFLSGLAPSAPSSLTIRIGIGEVLVPLAINNSIAQVILKRAINQGNTDLVFTAPVTGGQSVVYTVEYKYVDITAATYAGTYFFDNGNNSLFDTSLNGVLTFQLNTGTPATTGSETVPTTTSGWSPLYNIHVTNGKTTWYKLYHHANSPKLLKRNFLSEDLPLRIPTAAGGTTVTTYDPLAAWQLTTNQSIVATINLSSKQNSLNLYRDIKFDVNYASSVNTGNIAFQVSYATVASTGSLSALSFTSGTAETLTPPGTINTLAVSTLTETVPGYVLNSAAAQPKLLVIKFTRPVAGDTAGGNMLITGINAYQSW
jgi:hypothetical protein